MELQLIIFHLSLHVVQWLAIAIQTFQSPQCQELQFSQGVAIDD